MNIKEIIRDFIGSLIVFYGAFTMLAYSGGVGHLISIGVNFMEIPQGVTQAIWLNSFLAAIGFTVIRLKMKE